MVSAPLAGFAALSVAVSAAELFPFLELQSRSGTDAVASTFESADQALLALAVTAVLFTAVAVIHLHHAGAAAAGAANKRVSELAISILCGAAGVLQFIFFVQPLGAVGDVGALARALGRVALDALPASAAVVFFLGITLVIAHIRAGGEGGGGDAGNVNGRVPVPVDVLKKVALGAAAALLSQISIAALYAI